MNKPDFSFEQTIAGLVCGIDEAGRGPWAGPVTAAAVILPPDYHLEKLDDSKKLKEAERNRLEQAIKAQAIAYAIIHIDPAEIDQINILAATMKAMAQAVTALSVPPIHALIDGNRKPNLSIPATTIIKGDSKSASIAAAAILAKTARDLLMQEADNIYPHYGFGRHKGYGTPIHMEALDQYGPCPIHRLSFKPVAFAAKKWSLAEKKNQQESA